MQAKCIEVKSSVHGCTWISVSKTKRNICVEFCDKQNLVQENDRRSFFYRVIAQQNIVC